MVYEETSGLWYDSSPDTTLIQARDLYYDGHNRSVVPVQLRDQAVQVNSRVPEEVPGPRRSLARRLQGGHGGPGQEEGRKKKQESQGPEGARPGRALDSLNSVVADHDSTVTRMTPETPSPVSGSWSPAPRTRRWWWAPCSSLTCKGQHREPGP